MPPSPDILPLTFSPDADSILSFTPMGTVDDFFNFDLLSSVNGPNPAPSSSRSSSRSPSSSFWNLPPTPPLDTIPEIQDAASADSLYQAIYDQEKENSNNNALFSIFSGSSLPATVSGAELFGMSLPSSSSSPSGSSPSHVSPFAIDPALTAGSDSDFKTSPEQADIEEDEDNEELYTRPAPKVGGKGKSSTASRKGTVATGGVRKSSANNGPVMTQAVRRDDEPQDDDDWRPTPEEYKKMSSKEKRQLRNKISARNFRVRRKEYISTLEGDIAQRDNLIDAIRNELGSTKLENQSLRQEVEALKKTLLRGGITPDLPPPAPLSEVLPASVTGASNKENNKHTRQPLLAKPNTQKDLPSSPRISNAFWGGSLASGFGGVTPVHTTLIPDFAPLVPEKLAARAKAPLQENINPALNANPFFGIGANAHLDSTQQNQTKADFDTFADINMFNLKSMDAYRLHLWNKMGSRTFSHLQSPAINNTNNPVQNMYYPEGLAGQLRPSYFASPSKSSPTLSAILSGKSSTSDQKENKPSSIPLPTMQQAAIATLASQTFVQKLGSAFWDAFASPNTPSKNWDQEKVRKVLEGKAVVRIVDVPSTSTSSDGASRGVEALEESMKSLAIGGQGGMQSKKGGEKLMMCTEPCFLRNLRTGTSALSGKK